MIDGVIISPLKQILDERGKVMHMLRSDFPVFQQFGEIYFSCVYPGAIKGWHVHKKMILNYAVPHGNIKLVLYDDREGSPPGRTSGDFPGAGQLCTCYYPSSGLEWLQGNWTRDGHCGQLCLHTT